MASQKNGVNKSEEIRKLVKANPKIATKDIKAALAEKNIKVADALIYFVKGRMKQQKTQRTHFKAAVKVASTNGKGDVLATILHPSLRCVRSHQGDSQCQERLHHWIAAASLLHRPQLAR